MDKQTIAILLSVIIFLSACSTNSGRKSEERTEPIKIGVAAPLTGGWAVGGTAVRDGMLLAVEKLNTQGGINGKQVELVIEDTRSSVKDAVTIAQKLITTDHVPIVIGGGLSAEAMAIAPVAEETRTVFLSTIALTTPLEKAGEWVFKLRESTGKHAERTLNEIENRGYTRLAILSQQYEACDDFLDQMEKRYDTFSIEVIAIEKFEGQEVEDSDMRTQLLKLLDSNADALFVCGLYGELGLVFKQAEELGIDMPMFSMVAMENKKLFEVAGDTAEGTVYTSSKFSCEDERVFCDAFKEKFGRDPDYRAAFGYDSIMIIAQSIQQKGYTADGIRKGLLAIQDYDGATGKTSFDADGNAEKEVVVKQVRGREFVEIE